MVRSSAFGLAFALLASSAGAAELTLPQAVASPDRTPKLVARDAARHPAEELAFFGITPASHVVEIWPGTGYWTQILAPLLHDRGDYTAAVGAADANDQAEAFFAPTPAFKAMLASGPAYDRVHQVTFGAAHASLGAPGSATTVLTFRNLHNWMKAGDAEALLAAIHTVLAPGGVLGVEDHRASTRAPQDAKAANGYVRQDYAVALIERAGFKLAGSSEMDANPRDTADWPKGVWTLPPTYALGKTDHARYQAIGEADNFVLKFVKTGQ